MLFLFRFEVLSLVRDVSVMDYLPPVFHDVKEMIEIAKVENPVLEALWQEIENALLDQFLLLATERGIKRYEDMLHINVIATDVLETLTRFNEQVPYTCKVLRNLLNTLLGEGGYELTINGTLARYTHAQLAQYTHEQLRNEVLN